MARSPVPYAPLCCTAASLMLLLLAAPARATPIFEDANAALAGTVATVALWGDFDQDHDLDLLLVALDATRVYRNTGGSYSVYATLPGLYAPSAMWGDYDGDGDLDLLISGRFWPDPIYITRIYRKDPAGFVDINAGLTGVDMGRVQWVDYDNDGDLDAWVTGSDGGVSPVGTMYRNTAGTFASVSVGLPGIIYGTSEFGDYDGDGDQDMLISGAIQMVVNNRIGKLYRNVGGSFSATGVPVSSSVGSFRWGDYDSDGDLDYVDSENAGDAVYRNNGNGTFTQIVSGLPPGLMEWGDYDNDGDLDLVVFAGSLPNAYKRVYRNDGGAFNDASAGLPGWESGSAAWGDYDDDGLLDLALSGTVSYGPPADYHSAIYSSLISPPNSPPGAPAGLAASFDDQHMTLSWNDAVDQETPVAGLTYNVRIGSTPGGNEIAASMSAADGWRRVPQSGNVGHRLSWTLQGPPVWGTYYWSVQAVDAGFMGGPFAEEMVIQRSLDTPSGLPRDLEFSLRGANPVSGPVAFRLSLPTAGRVRLGIYDLAGRRVAQVADEALAAGVHELSWRSDLRGPAAGVYYARLEVGPRTITRKFVTLE